MSVAGGFLRLGDGHASADDPVQALLVARSYGLEELRMPVDAIVVAFGRLLSLPFFNLRLCIGSDILISLLHGFANIMPEPLGLALVLLLQRPSRWGGVSRMCGVEDELLFARLRFHVSSDVATARSRGCGAHGQILDVHFLVP